MIKIRIRMGVLLWWAEDSFKRISNSVLPCSLTINKGSPGTGWGPWWGEGPGEATCRTPTWVLTPVLLSVLAQTGSREWEEPHPTHLQDEQEVPVDRVEAVGEGFRAAQETLKVLRAWKPGSGQELKHAGCVFSQTEAVLQRGFLPGLSSPKAWKVSVRGNLPPAPPLKPNLRLPPLWVLPEEGHPPLSTYNAQNC